MYVANHFGAGANAGVDQVALLARVFHEELNFVILSNY